VGQPGYEILCRLARGGMAELFLARAVGPQGFEKLIVVKKILPKLASNAKFLELFVNEARIAAALDHPHIAHVYEFGKDDTSYFMTMEYLHGQNMLAVLRRNAMLQQQLAIDHVVHIGRCVAAALHYAHERRRPSGELMQIVHRDVSPANIVVGYDGAVKLVDFGVAKVMSNPGNTRTGIVKGKISYMSPEQAKGETIDRRADVFALGIVLWEMTTMQRLFKTENDLQTLQSIIHDRAPRPSERRPTCPVELDRILLRALERDPTKRYQTAEELEIDLEELAREQKLRQSTIALRLLMQQLFEPELGAWREAQEAGATLTDYVIAQSGNTNATVPMLEVDEQYEYEDEDDDDDDRTREIDPSSDENDTLESDGREPDDDEDDFEPPTTLQSQFGTIDHPTEVLAAPLPPAPGPAPTAPMSASPFPIAPMEWRPETTTPVPNVRPADRRMMIATVVGLSILLIVLVIVLAR
jgi:serine/threonine protein kinase